MKKQKRVLIIDQNNQFLRFWIVDPSLSQNGDPIGGLQGSLKGLQKLCKDICPDKIIVCWDGPGGSRKRKLINKNYKEGRTPPRLNWNSSLMTEDEQYDNKIWQMLRLSEYYDEMPITQLLIENVEADDVIATVCQMEELKDWQKVIVSADKDFIQLLNKKTILYRPTQKDILNVKTVSKKYGIPICNFSVVRSMVKDASDNIQGIKGAGFSTIVKRIPFISKREVTIQDVIAYCKQRLEEDKNPLKIYQNIVEGEKRIYENYKMIQLSSPSIGYVAKEKVKREVNRKDLIWNKTNFYKMMVKDGFGVWSWDFLNQTFNKIILNQKENIT